MMRRLLDGLALFVTSGLLSSLAGAGIGGAAGLPLACLSGGYSLWAGVLIGGVVGLACALVALTDPNHPLDGVCRGLGVGLGLGAGGGVLAPLAAGGPRGGAPGGAGLAFPARGAPFFGGGGGRCRAG